MASAPAPIPAAAPIPVPGLILVAGLAVARNLVPAAGAPWRPVPRHPFRFPPRSPRRWTTPPAAPAGLVRPIQAPAQGPAPAPDGGSGPKPAPGPARITGRRAGSARAPTPGSGRGPGRNTRPRCALRRAPPPGRRGQARIRCVRRCRIVAPAHGVALGTADLVPGVTWTAAAGCRCGNGDCGSRGRPGEGAADSEVRLARRRRRVSSGWRRTGLARAGRGGRSGTARPAGNRPTPWAEVAVVRGPRGRAPGAVSAGYGSYCWPSGWS